MRRRIFSFFVVLMLLCAMSVPVMAHDVPDLTKTGSVTITMRHGDGVIPGGTLTIFRVGEVREDDGNYSFVLTGDFAGSGVSLEDIQSASLPDALAKYAGEKGLTGVTEKIDENANGKFSGLEPGLYLVVQYKAAEGYNPANPFLVSLPGMENGIYIYDVDASPKLDPITEKPTQPPAEPSGPKDPTLPQTGQMNWPVPVLVMGGLFLFVLGWAMCFGRRKEN